jgi:hypothetical protein
VYLAQAFFTLRSRCHKIIAVTNRLIRRAFRAYFALNALLVLGFVIFIESKFYNLRDVFSIRKQANMPYFL